MSKKVPGQELKPGDIVIHPRCPDWGQGRVVSSRGTKLDIRFSSGGIRTFGPGIPFELVSDDLVENEFKDPILLGLTENSLWGAIKEELLTKERQAIERGAADLVVHTVVDQHPNLITIGDSRIIRRSQQKNGNWGKRQPISKHRFWVLAKLAMQKGEHILEESPHSEGFNGCIICSILDMLPWFDCLGSNGKKKQRIVFTGAQEN